MLSADVPIASAQQDGQPLNPRNGGWPLTSFAGRLSINPTEGAPINVPLFDKSPLIFKLNQDWTGDGRRVPRVTKGHFIVIAPAEWIRSGHVPIEPDGCSDSAFRAHYFFRDGTESTGDLGGFQGRDIPSSAPGFELSGRSVFDDSEDGDLFVGTPPRLTTADRVVWARVGAEDGSGWEGDNFKPSERSLADVMDARQGRFFLRVYDQRGLLDGAQFRYLGGLREIRVNGASYSRGALLLPSATGHPPTTVQFIGVDGVSIHASPKPGAAPVEDGIGELIAEPRPEADEVSCTLEAGGGRVDVALHLPRIWWRMEGEAGKGDGEWRGTSFTMTREDFQEHANSNANLRLRLPKRIRSVAVGFGDECHRRYIRREDGFLLPLSHFVDYVQIDRRLTEDALFNVQIGPSTDRAVEPLTLIRVLADPPPTIVSLECKPEAIAAGEKTLLSWVTRNADDVRVVFDHDIGAVESTGSREIAPLETTTYTLRLSATALEDVERSVTVRVSPAQQDLDLGERRHRTRSRAWFLQIHYRWETLSILSARVPPVGARLTLQQALADTLQHRLVAPGRIEYLDRLVQTFEDNQDIADAVLSTCLDNWPLDRLSVIDRGILRLGATEILFFPDLPSRVAIQESVRLAQRYGSDESPRFVNGVLDAVYRSVQPKPKPTSVPIPKSLVRPPPGSVRKPVAKVRRGGGGWRPGRGFSCGELYASGISEIEASRRSIRIDRRRRSVHSTNMNNLRQGAHG